MQARTGAFAAVATASTPPGGAAIRRASPPAAGSSHRAGLSTGAGPPPRPAGAAGRRAANTSEPSGRNRGLPSPSAPRVSRTGARSGAVSSRQMLVTYLRGSPAAVWTPAASQLPSGDSRSEVSRGIDANALTSVKLVTCLLSLGGQPWEASRGRAWRHDT